MSRTGGCMCGDVRYEITNDITETGACHCQMCRKFTGGVFMAVTAPKAHFKLTKSDGLALYASSSWAERAFCKTCGSSLFYRITLDGPIEGECHVGIGTLDDAEGIALTSEIYIDCKPGGYSFAEATDQMTEADVIAKFLPDEG